MIIKKLLPLLLTMVLLTGCSTNNSTTKTDGLTIVTTNFFLYDMARTVLGSAGEAVLLITPGTESHDFEVTLSDMAKIENCDLFAFVGGEGENWVYETLEAFDANGVEIPTFCAMAVVEEQGFLCHSAGEHDHNHDNHAENHWDGMDDHVWLSVSNALVVYEAMLDSLTERYDTFIPADQGDMVAEMTRLEDKIRALVDSTEKPFLLVADRFPYRYLTESYGIDYLAAFDGCTSDTEPSLETVNALVEAAKSMDNPVLLVTELSDRQTAEAVAKQVPGTQIWELHSCHNVTGEDYAAGVTYLDLMERNYTVWEKLWK